MRPYIDYDKLGVPQCGACRPCISRGKNGTCVERKKPSYVHPALAPVDSWGTLGAFASPALVPFDPWGTLGPLACGPLFNPKKTCCNAGENSSLMRLVLMQGQ